jgi:excisionase family DNA binding protein
LKKVKKGCSPDGGMRFFQRGGGKERIARWGLQSLSSPLLARTERMKEKTEQKEQMFRKRLLSVEETAAYLNISARTIYNQIGARAKKRFPVKPKRIGRLVRFDIRDLDEHLDSL